MIRFQGLLKQSNLHYIILIALAYCVTMVKLGAFHIRWWDESMFAVNTFEMLERGSWFSLYFDGHPDLFNTKPPLTNWLQSLSVTLFGYNETSLRLPSALATFLTIILLFKFCAGRFGFKFAWIASLILITSSGFIHFHSSRTADSDALLTLFLLLTNLSFLKFLETKEKKHILYFFIFITLAFNTKLYAALLFAPAYLAILLIYHSFKAFTVNWQFVTGIAFFTATSVALVYLRENETPGYLSEILFKDAGRMMTVVEDHGEPWSFYFDNFFNWRFSIWAIFFLVGLFLAFKHPQEKTRQVLVSCIIMIASYLAIIMASVTKLEWYDMPLFPLLALIAALPIHQLVSGWGDKPIHQYGLVLLVFAFPYYRVFDKVQGNAIPNGERTLEANEIFLHRKSQSEQDLNGLKIYHHGWKGSLLFYKYKYSQQDQDLHLITEPVSLQALDKVLVCHDSLKHVLAERFEYTVLESHLNADLIQIKKRRPRATSLRITENSLESTPR